MAYLRHSTGPSQSQSRHRFVSSTDKANAEPQLDGAGAMVVPTRRTRRTIVALTSLATLVIFARYLIAREPTITPNVSLDVLTEANPNPLEQHAPLLASPRLKPDGRGDGASKKQNGFLKTRPKPAKVQKPSQRQEPPPQGALSDDGANALAVERQAPSRKQDARLFINRLSRVECTDEVQARLADPALWSVRRSAQQHFKIAPLSFKDVPAYCISQAVLSARLVNDELTTIRALPSPHYDTKSSSFSLVVPSLTLPRDTYTLEVRLDFGYLEKARVGMVCGNTREACSPASVLAAQGAAYIGKVIAFDDPRHAILTLGATDVTVLSPQESCSTYTTFDGYWSDQQYHPTPAGRPCHLVTPSFPAPFAALTSAKRRRPIVWISLIGDSNARTLSTTLANTLGTGPTKLFVSSAPTAHQGTLASIAFKSSTGVYDGTSGGDDVEPDVILTWQWYFQTQGLDKFESSARNLTALATGSLGDVLAANELLPHVRRFKRLSLEMDDLYPTRTYISLGSHSEELTTLGAASFLSILISQNYLTSALLSRSHVRFFTTTFVKSSNIPARFPRQDLLRNNAIIRARNDLLKEWPGLENRVVDVEALTDGITPDWMKVKPGGALDAVHFEKWVYQAWASLVWTDLVAAEFVD